MIKTGLEFAQGTAEDCQRLVGQLFDPGDILEAYRTARMTHRAGDIVLVTLEHDPSGIVGMSRRDYLKGEGLTAASSLAIAHKSAHKVAQLPWESDAMWFLIKRRANPTIMCVIYATPYKTEATSPVS